ncbi:Uncharacterized protein dnm_050890 [Desulfonema magnum]|uniref:Uncharacterized protein n=1 Tax=Desulfonema magnum TaxID=45655 RepID=A0A975BPH0_9BACT|nr:Uncharacterized protein dnm_050890 [Desulfonema magnum]
MRLIHEFHLFCDFIISSSQLTPDTFCRKRFSDYKGFRGGPTL